VKHFNILSKSEKETIFWGRKVGAHLIGGDVVALVGELGSGKTWLTKGIALGLDVHPKTIVTSPSFALVNEYAGRLTFFHIDIYRMESISELVSVGIEEYLNSEGVVAMEWADKWPEILPERSVTISIDIMDENSRKIMFSGQHPRALFIIDAVRKEMEK
jgi:tRNA threonylcarbamoyladenosine biosynthesis protein TsaE